MGGSRAALGAAAAAGAMAISKHCAGACCGCSAWEGFLLELVQYEKVARTAASAAAGRVEIQKALGAGGQYRWAPRGCVRVSSLQWLGRRYGRMQLVSAERECACLLRRHGPKRGICWARLSCSTANGAPGPLLYFAVQAEVQARACHAPVLGPHGRGWVGSA